MHRTQFKWRGFRECWNIFFSAQWWTENMFQSVYRGNNKCSWKLARERSHFYSQRKMHIQLITQFVFYVYTFPFDKCKTNLQSLLQSMLLSSVCITSITKSRKLLLKHSLIRQVSNHCSTSQSAVANLLIIGCTKAFPVFRKTPFMAVKFDLVNVSSKLIYSHLKSL